MLASLNLSVVRTDMFVVVLVVVLVLEGLWVHVICDRPVPGGEPLLIASKEPGAISLGASMATNCFKQAAPANVSTRGLSPGA